MANREELRAKAGNQATVERQRRLTYEKGRREAGVLAAHRDLNQWTSLVERKMGREYRGVSVNLKVYQNSNRLSGDIPPPNLQGDEPFWSIECNNKSPNQDAHFYSVELYLHGYAEELQNLLGSPPFKVVSDSQSDAPALRISW